MTARRYMGPAIFADDPTPDQFWTLVVDRGAADTGTAETVLIHFLMDDAPHERLAAGTAFHLTEGATVVADGEVSDVFELSIAA